MAHGFSGKKKNEDGKGEAFGLWVRYLGLKVHMEMADEVSGSKWQKK